MIDVSPITTDDIDVLDDFAGVTDHLCTLTDMLSIRVSQLTREGLPIATLTEDELARLRAAVASALVDVIAMVNDLENVRQVLG